MLDVDLHIGDVCESRDVRSAVADCSVIFHTAGPVGVHRNGNGGLEQMHHVHLEGTKQVLLQADPGCRVVHTSSIVAVGATQTLGQVVNEESPFNLDSLGVPYVQAKRTSELLALASSRDVVVVNPSYLVGPEDYFGSVMGRFVLRFLRGRILCSTHGGLNFVDVRDVARGHLLAAQFGQSQRRYILAGENLTMQQWHHRIARIAGFSPRVHPCLPIWLLQQAAHIAEYLARDGSKEPHPSYGEVEMLKWFWHCSSERAERELGWQARPLEECLHDSIEWMRTYHRVRLRAVNRWLMRPKKAA
jgi:dihydroflavonol-4-reductase